MAEIFLNGRVELHCGDMLAVLPTLEDSSIDSCVCDPPYHLVQMTKRYSSPDAKPCGAGKDGSFRRLTAGFMGKQWDGGDIAFQVETWRQVLRVLKPGAHLIAFSGTRTYHRMACAIEDAGFEIRDQVGWCYGLGFPKSHDVSKGIDRARGDNADWRAVGQWLRERREAAGLKQKEVSALWPSVTGGVTGCVANWELGFNCPKWGQWLSLKGCIGFGDEMDAEVWRLNGRKGTPGEAWHQRSVIKEKPYSFPAAHMNASTFADEYDPTRIRLNETAPATDAARQWEGWGTALKPAWEPSVLARKPLSEPTIAANVLRWGTGALNIDKCRVATNGEDMGDPQRFAGAGNHEGWDRLHKHDAELMAERADGRFDRVKSLGRWPANVIHDGSEEVIAAFPESESKSEGNRGTSQIWGCAHGQQERNGFDDSGSAARFFYTSKADTDDRLGSKHPTVKPLDLMQYLVRLVTPRDGLVLDPFAGTGTTGEAAFREGMRAVLIERETEYQVDIRRRMALVLAGPDERARESIKERMRDKPRDDGPLFGVAE